jgi:tRNA nucleotidyltransferase/poly(A) polymerase
VFDALAAAGLEARAVGGVVRNALMGRPVTDIDIATPARPEAVMAAARAAGLEAVPTGIEHGTVTIVSARVPYEVTTLRRDVATDGRRAVVAFTNDWAQDAQRRDFTMNALYCDAAGRIHDPVGGKDDLAAGRVRFIGDADARIQEDYLRILRFFRMHATYGRGDLDSAGLAACVRGRSGLAQLSAERIRAELVKLLVAPRAIETSQTMLGHGLLADVLGVAPRPGVLAAAVAGEAALGRAPDAMLRLSALAMAVEDDRARLAHRLRLSSTERDSLVVIDQALGARLGTLNQAQARRTLYRLKPDRWRRDVGGLAALGPAHHAAAQRLQSLAETWVLPILPLRGADVLAVGIPPGPEVGAILAEIEDWWVAADFPSGDAVRGRLASVLATRKG